MPDTENASPRFRDIDQWPTADIIEAMIEGQLAAVSTLHAARATLAAAVDAAASRLGDTGRLIYVGAGTSGRLGALDAAELYPTFNWPRERTIFMMAGGEPALVRSAEGAEDDEAEAERQMRALVPGTSDVVIGLAASGRTPFAIAALKTAREQGALTIAITNNPASAITRVVDFALELPTGAELIAGSTRMKAGTAQKIALTIFSSTLMIALGYIYRGRMVQMRVSNAKLDARAVAMVADLAECDTETARKALTAADGQIKTAIVMAARRLSLTEAEKRLAERGGNLRAALELGN